MQTSDLVLPPLSSADAQASFTRAHPSVIIDKKIELHSGLIRDQLKLPLNTIEDYVAEVKLVIKKCTVHGENFDLCHC